MRYAYRAAISCVLCLILVSLVRASDGRPFDAVTGRDTRNYPPDPQVDYKHIRLEIDMRDPSSRSFTCNETITFHTPLRPIDRLQLDAVELQIRSVTDLQGQKLRFRYDDKKLTVRFPSPLSPDSDGGLKIAYACVKPKEGMIFALPDDSYRDRPVCIHTQGESETNRYWFISHDYPNARQTTEILVTIPSKLSALSNGALIAREDVGNSLTRWHYRLGHPHVSYLVSLVVGEFAVVKDTWRGKPVEYWVPPANEANARRTFGKTPEMIELFSKLTGFDYPWEKYAQVVVYNFGAGGMENTSCTTLVEMTDLDERAALDNDVDGLVSHELAHQWFGDTLTCRTWPHIWLNEGFATYMDAVWHEHAHGPQDYAHQIWSSMQGVAASDDVNAKGGVVFPYFNEPDETFGRGVSNPYSKGSSVLHLLRRSLGDELFWKVISTYVKRNAFKSVETDDLRKVADELSGRSYEQFFQQWLYRAGSPHVKVKYEWDDAAHEARITLEQTQPISESAPAFIADVPVWFADADGNVVAKQTIAMQGRTASTSAKLDREPQLVAIDPERDVLAQWEVGELPAPMLIAMARGGPTPFARFDGIAALGTQDRDDARAALKSILLDEKRHETERSEAAAALGKMQQPAARDILLDALREGSAIADHHVRRAAVEALGSYRDPVVVPTLIRFAKSDPTYTIEAIATAALGKQTQTDQIVQTLMANAKKPSYRDQIRSNAVEALGALSAAGGLTLAMDLGAYGQPFRSRPTGIAAVAKIAHSHEKKDDARQFFLKLLDDPQERSASAAIRALGELGDDKAIPQLKALADGSARKNLRDEARNAIDAINSRQGESGTVKGLRERIEALEKARAESEKHTATRGETKDQSPATAPTTQP
jgi:aminopeptidase N